MSASPVPSEGLERGDYSHSASPRDLVDDEIYPEALSEATSSPAGRHRAMWPSTSPARENCRSIASSDDAAEDGGIGQVPSLGSTMAGEHDQFGSFWVGCRR